MVRSADRLPAELELARRQADELDGWIARARDPDEDPRELELEAIEAGKDDDRVKLLVLDLNYMGGAGLSKLQALKRAIEDFKTTGKKVIATSDFYLQSQYYLASLADEVLLNHQGIVWTPGYGSYSQYY